MAQRHSLTRNTRSSVLRDLAASASVHLTGGNIPTLALPEPSSTLGPFLAVLTHNSDPLPSAPNVVHDLPTLSLLVKYDCAQALTYTTTTLKCLLMEAHTGAVCPFQAFILGAHLGDLDLCRTAIVHGDVPPLDSGAQAALKPYRDALPKVYTDALRSCWNASADPRTRGNLFVEYMSLSDSEGELGA